MRAVVASDGRLGGFALPDGALGVNDVGGPVQWHPQTVAWWQSWRASPQGCRMVTDVDWQFLLDTARMHHEFWTRGRWEFGAELRLRVAKFGATPEDRSRLRFEIDISNDIAVVGTANTSSRNADRHSRWRVDPVPP
ncbi:hypothetical protein C3B61_06955 [Cryobacterium zongtaii]|uniref:Uncharacterized protein n=1 Tax=Cryobacterium zongtaii TaxID=1259217 RepID=A0A2S3ZJ91_9MICO|nr:hypothetical protein C3B61_06955 [Cryobacterium zongtaii]